VSTRKLILTAVACGLAILIAGGVFLVRTARNRDQLTVVMATVGDHRSVGGAEVVVQSWRRVGTQTLAVVGVSYPSSASAINAESPWVMLAGSKLVAEVPGALDAGEVACRGETLRPGTPTTCVLAFAGTTGSPFLAFALNGAQAQWRLAP
jgi:hypothetical protein